MNEPSRILARKPTPEEVVFEASLRPRTFQEVIGQERVTGNLRVFVEAARRRGDALDHVLFCGPPGLGKTTLAHVIAAELGVRLYTTSGPAIEKRGDLAGMLTTLEAREVIFIDEIHRLQPAVEEKLYPAMEDYKFDLVLDSGPHARSLQIDLKPFTLVGATTRTGLLGNPLRDRFGIQMRLDFYAASELCAIVRRSAGILGIDLSEDGAMEIARRSRGTPRIANRLLRRVRDFAEVEGSGRIDRAMADGALGRLEVDARGLDSMDRRLLLALVDKFGGGPVGIDSLAAAVGEESGTLEDVYEPYLIQEGFLHRTPRGRLATQLAYAYLGRKGSPAGGQGELL